jgi:hypothetical protein
VGFRLCENPDCTGRFDLLSPFSIQNIRLALTCFQSNPLIKLYSNSHCFHIKLWVKYSSRYITFFRYAINVVYSIKIKIKYAND